jgi:hypothetical protein
MARRQKETTRKIISSRRQHHHRRQEKVLYYHKSSSPSSPPARKSVVAHAAEESFDTANNESIETDIKVVTPDSPNNSKSPMRGLFGCNKLKSQRIKTETELGVLASTVADTNKSSIAQHRKKQELSSSPKRKTATVVSDGGGDLVTKMKNNDPPETKDTKALEDEETMVALAAERMDQGL